MTKLTTNNTNTIALASLAVFGSLTAFYLIKGGVKNRKKNKPKQTKTKTRNSSLLKTKRTFMSDLEYKYKENGFPVDLGESMKEEKKIISHTDLEGKARKNNSSLVLKVENEKFDDLYYVLMSQIKKNDSKLMYK